MNDFDTDVFASIDFVFLETEKHHYTLHLLIIQSDLEYGAHDLVNPDKFIIESDANIYLDYLLLDCNWLGIFFSNIHRDVNRTKLVLASFIVVETVYVNTRLTGIYTYNSLVMIRLAGGSHYSLTQKWLSVHYLHLFRR